MRVLTVRQPWAWAIVHAGKSPENRPLVWNYTGEVAIHSGKEWDLRALDDPAILTALADHGIDVDRVRAGLEGRRFPISSALGVVTMIGAHRSDEGCCPGNPWARRLAPDEAYVGHHKLVNPRPLPYPITPVTGRLGLWRPDQMLEDRITLALIEGALGA